MKKKLSILMILILCFSLAACGASEEQDVKEGSIQTDEKMLSVDITIPASFWEGTDMATFDPETYVEENNFKKAVINEDGSVTVTMSKARHTEVMSEMETSVEENLVEMIGAEQTPYIKDITYDKNFEKVTVSVDRAEYENAFIDMTPLMVGITVSLYQAFKENEPYCEVVIEDAATKEVIQSTIYPDALED